MLNMEIIDLKDKKILFELEQNARQSFSKLAKKVRLSKETLFHRIKSLEKKKIINGYLAEINIYKLGYQFFPLLLKFQNSTPSKEKEVMNFLQNHKSVAWLTVCEGNWDINLTLLTNNNLELKKFFDKFNEKFAKFLAKKELMITSEIHYFKRSFFLDKSSKETISLSSEGQIKKLDETNKKIISILGNNARTPLIEIANKLKITAKTVASRIKKLEKEKILQGSRAFIDVTKLGYKFYKTWFSLNNCSKEQQQKLFSYFKNNPHITWATKLLGSFDLSIELEVSSTQKFREIIEEIKKNFSSLIKNHESIMIFEETLINYYP